MVKQNQWKKQLKKKAKEKFNLKEKMKKQPIILLIRHVRQGYLTIAIFMWKKDIERHIEMNEPMQVKLFMRRSKVDMNVCKTEMIFSDIRRYFESQEVNKYWIVS